MKNFIESQESVKSRVYIIRGTRVMLDEDLAKLYGVPTKALIQAVKRNRERFPSDLCTIFWTNQKTIQDINQGFKVASGEDRRLRHTSVAIRKRSFPIAPVRSSPGSFFRTCPFFR